MEVPTITLDGIVLTRDEITVPCCAAKIEELPNDTNQGFVPCNVATDPSGAVPAGNCPKIEAPPKLLEGIVWNVTILPVGGKYAIYLIIHFLIRPYYITPQMEPLLTKSKAVYCVSSNTVSDPSISCPAAAATKTLLAA